MIIPYVLETELEDLYIFCKVCEASNTTPDKYLREHIKAIVEQATKKPATKEEPLPEAKKIDTKETMDDLGDYLGELSREKTKLERDNKPEELAKVKAEIKEVTKKMMEMS
jgi:hypothetical protein